MLAVWNGILAAQLLLATSLPSSTAQIKTSGRACRSRCTPIGTRKVVTSRRWSTDQVRGPGIGAFVSLTWRMRQALLSAADRLTPSSMPETNNQRRRRLSTPIDSVEVRARGRFPSAARGVPGWMADGGWWGHTAVLVEDWSLEGVAQGWSRCYNAERKGTSACSGDLR